MKAIVDTKLYQLSTVATINSVENLHKQRNNSEERMTAAEQFNTTTTILFYNIDDFIPK